MKRKLLSSIIVCGLFSYSTVWGMDGDSLVESGCEKIQMQVCRTVSEFVSKYSNLIDNKIKELNSGQDASLQAKIQKWEEMKNQKSTSIRRRYLIKKAAMEIMNFNISNPVNNINVFMQNKNNNSSNFKNKNKKEWDNNVHQFDEFFDNPDKQQEINTILENLEKKYSNDQEMDSNSFIKLLGVDSNKKDLKRAVGKLFRYMSSVDKMPNKFWDGKKWNTVKYDKEKMQTYLKRFVGILAAIFQKDTNNEYGWAPAAVVEAIIDNEKNGGSCPQGFCNRLYQVVNALQDI